MSLKGSHYCISEKQDLNSEVFWQSHARACSFQNLKRIYYVSVSSEKLSQSDCPYCREDWDSSRNFKSFFLYRGLFRNFYPKNGGLRLCMTVGIWIGCYEKNMPIYIGNWKLCKKLFWKLSELPKLFKSWNNRRSLFYGNSQK